MELNRRNLFKLGALAGAVGTLPKWVQTLLPAPFRPDLVAPQPVGPESWVPSACSSCGEACGALVRVIQGRACGIKGDPNHPASRGALCPKGLAALQELYHPDRVRQPLRRAGKRGEGAWEPISWDEALKLAADRLGAVRQKDPSRLGILTGPAAGLDRALCRRFAQAFGTPHCAEAAPPPSGLPDEAGALMMGAESGVTFDLGNAGFVLSFCDWLESLPGSVQVGRAFGTLRRGSPDKRVRILSAEPRMSVSAAKADEWLPVHPGTEGLLALGIAHVLIQRGLHNEAFVRDQTQGFAEFKELVMSRCAPEAVAAATDVPAETVDRLAGEFAARRPALALCDRRGLEVQMAVLALNALVGSIGCVGGVRRKAKDAAATVLGGGEGAPAVAQFLPPPTAGFEALMLVQANPSFLAPLQMRPVLDGAAFVVSITSFLDDTAQQADLILPAHHRLESLSASAGHTLGGSPLLSLSSPVVKPLYETRPAGDVVIELARRLGGPLAARFPWTSYADALKEGTKPLYEGKRGKLLREVELEDDDFAKAGAETLDRWFQKLCRAGGWSDLESDAKPQPPEFSTASRKFEFHAAKLGSLLAPGPSRDADFPLHLCVYVPQVFSGGEGAHLPYLQGIAGSRFGERGWGTWAEINPDTAKPLGIQDGDLIAVASPAGRIPARARLFAGARPDVVSIPFGFGHAASGPGAERAGSNVAALLETDPATGKPGWDRTRVRIVRG